MEGESEADEEGARRSNEADFFSFFSSVRLGTGDMMLKDDAARGMLDVISLYPEDTKFFINAWTWGSVFLSPLHDSLSRRRADLLLRFRRRSYEELLLGISSTFPEDKVSIE